jgi:hypothetical protein
MNTLKFKKWLGLTLLCLAILSAPLAQLGLQAAQNLQDRSSQLEFIQEDGEQIDMIDSPHQLVNADPADGAADLASPVQSGSTSVILPAGTAKAIDNTGRIQGAFLNPEDGEYEYVPAGYAKVVDNTGRIQGAFLNPEDGEYEYVPAGYAKVVDNTGRIQGAFLNPEDGEYEYVPAGTAKMLDNTGRIQGSFISTADGEYEYVPAGTAKTLDPSGRIPGN